MGASGSHDFWWRERLSPGQQELCQGLTPRIGATGWFAHAERLLPCSRPQTDRAIGLALHKVVDEEELGYAGEHGRSLRQPRQRIMSNE